MTALQRLVKTRLKQLGLSYREAAKRSDGMASHATFYQLATGQHSGRVSDRTINGLALALELSAREVREAAGLGDQEEPPEFRLPKRAGRLTQRQRRVILAMVDALLEEEQAKEAPKRARSSRGSGT